MMLSAYLEVGKRLCRPDWLNAVIYESCLDHRHHPETLVSIERQARLLSTLFYPVVARDMAAVMQVLHLHPGKEHLSSGRERRQDSAATSNIFGGT